MFNIQIALVLVLTLLLLLRYLQNSRKLKLVHTNIKENSSTVRALEQHLVRDFLIELADSLKGRYGIHVECNSETELRLAAYSEGGGMRTVVQRAVISGRPIQMNEVRQIFANLRLQTN